MAEQPAGDDSPASAGQVLRAEYRFLHGGQHEAVRPGGDDLEAALADHATAAHSALCLSGGGIRSASFNLGVLQGLARAGVLEKFDYLSTVSGGGYIGGWLTAWRTRARAQAAPDPIAQLASAAPPVDGGEPDALARLRRHIRFLDPRLSVHSTDVWTLATIILRNLLLIWVVLVPLLGAAALVPRLYLGVLGLPSQPELVSQAHLEAWYFHDWLVALPLFGGAALFAALELPSLGNRRHGQRAFLVCFLLPVVLGEAIVSVHRYWAWQFGGSVPLRSAVLVAAVGMALPWILGGWMSARVWRPWTWIAAAAAGAAGRWAIWGANHTLTEMARHHPELFAVLDMPLTLGLVFGQMTLFAGLASRDMTDGDREWWGRAAAWILMTAVLWSVVGTLAIYGPDLLGTAFATAGLSERAGHAWVGLLTLATGGAASRLGSSWTRVASGRQRLERALFVLAAPAVVLLVILLLATADLRLLEHVHRLNLFREVTDHAAGASLPEDALVLAGLLIAGLLASRLVSVNDFSLHSMYRQRLARAFLGASRPPAARRPNPFTGFDDADDQPMHEAVSAGPPLHVVNATLNLVAENTLAMQERQAESFTMTALHAGARQVGYRPSSAYAGGLSLAEAITLSGAAVSPNMGAASKPALTFLLTLFNARLGAWLANPGAAGSGVWRGRHSSYGAAPLLNEMFGRTSDKDAYVYLSDGGHFENLGLYEMVMRRCRFIVVSDAGCDPDYRFDDLANAIRKVRLDMGVEIEFPHGLGIAGEGATCRARAAVGRIRYSSAREGADDGVLLYMKAAVCGDEPVDVANYAATHPLFPHQPTTNQWFRDDQFESYRMLGLHTVLTLAGDEPAASVEALCAAAAAPRGSATTPESRLTRGSA